MPLYFIENKGQMDNWVFYYVQGQDKTLYFGSEGLTFILRELKGPEELIRSWVLKLDFMGANPGVLPEGLEETGAVISYFKGPREDWKTGLPTYFKVAYRELWPGIDLIFSGHVQELKYEFVVKPWADPSLIRLCYRGAQSVRVIDSGEMEVKSPVASFKDGKPVAWQDIDGRRKEVSLAYHLEDSSLGSRPKRSVGYGFQVGSYDRSHPLILDPATLIYCGYIGGSGNDIGNAIAVDALGNAYVTGYTDSSQTTFPDTVGPDLTHNGNSDAFVAKVKSDGTGLIYCGYIGGSGSDVGNGIAVDGSGNVYVAGDTSSSQATFPAIVGPDLTHSGNSDAFVAKVKSNGTGLIYCGYIGGSGNDIGNAIAVDALGNAYVTGYTDSSQTTFPDTVGPDLTHNGNSDAFVAKVKSNGTGLIYCGYIGGSSGEAGRDIAVDALGNAYITGYTDSSQTTFPDTVGPDLTHNGSSDAFVAKVKSDGTGLDYCGYIGGSGNDYGNGVAVDGSGNAYVTGNTYSSQTTFPDTVGPDLTHNGSSDAFVAKVKSDGTGLDYCGYIGGSSADNGLDVAVDGSGNAYVAGYTSSNETTFPVTRGPDLTHNGWVDAFVAKVKFDGAGLNYCGYIGGIDEDYGQSIAVDGSGNAYVMGDASSSDVTFPAIVGPDLTHNGSSDAFVAKISAEAYPPSNFRLERLENDLIFFNEYINRLTWEPNPLNVAIMSYRLYRKTKDQLNSAFVLYYEFDAGPVTSFDDRGLKKDDLFTYRMTSMSATGTESEPVEAGN